MGVEKGVEKVPPLPPAAHGSAGFSCGKVVDHLCIPQPTGGSRGGAGVWGVGGCGAEKGVEKKLLQPAPPAHCLSRFSCGKAVDHLKRGGLILLFCCTARACPGTARSVRALQGLSGHCKVCPGTARSSESLLHPTRACVHLIGRTLHTRCSTRCPLSHAR